MSTPEAPAAGTLTDISGESFYISFVPSIARHKDGRGDLAVVVVKINGSENTIPAGHAWKTGLTMLRTSFHVAALNESGNLPLQLSTGISFSCGDSPELQLDAETAEEIGSNFMGAAVSAVHDMTVFRHLTTAGGMSVEQVIGLFEDIEPINSADFFS